jgi:hypothetical protein
VHRFDFPVLKREFPHALGNTVVPGNCHLALIDFVRHHDDFDHYWVIEYDVRFTGDWAVFFNAFAEDDADLLGCHIRRRHDEPCWNWWPTLVGPHNRAAPTRRSAPGGAERSPGARTVDLPLFWSVSDYTRHGRFDLYPGRPRSSRRMLTRIPSAHR